MAELRCTGRISASHIKPMNLVLASQSPRRKELLAILGYPFTVIPAAIDETPVGGEAPDAFVVRVAREKGIDVAARVSESVIISADTVVTIDDEILSKPTDENDAIRMLRKLSGRDHWVLTAVVIVNQVNHKTLEGLDRTRVWFESLSEEQIVNYVRRENVFDKAGAYAIQGYAGVYIPRIEGNYFNVMGFPLPLVRQLLCRALS
jgi:septum formation protein